MNSADSIYQNMKDDFDLSIDLENTTDKIIVFRSTINTEMEACRFIEVFSIKSNCNYIVYYQNCNPQRITFAKAWICQHSKRRKSKKSKRNADCESSVNIVIKKITRSTAKSDAFLRQMPVMPCKIQIRHQHNHLIDTVDSLRMLRVSDEIKQQFFQYFCEGLTVSQARHFHENKMLVEGKDIREIANSSKNPTARQISYLHKIWRTANFGFATDRFDKLQGKPAYDVETDTVLDDIKEEVLQCTEIQRPALVTRQNIKNTERCSSLRSGQQHENDASSRESIAFNEMGASSNVAVRAQNVIFKEITSPNTALQVKAEIIIGRLMSFTYNEEDYRKISHQLDHVLETTSKGIITTTKVEASESSQQTSNKSALKHPIVISL